MIILLVARTNLEDTALKKELKDYPEYHHKTRRIPPLYECLCGHKYLQLNPFEKGIRMDNFDSI